VTVVVMSSVKGSPGVTTLACLVGASWLTNRRVILVECDPSGGDLAPRFMLSNRSGWSTMTSLARRGGADLTLDPHLQSLPGGLEVLVASPPRDLDREMLLARRIAERAVERCGESNDLIVDLGRLPVSALGESAKFWLNRADRSVIVSRTDPASIMHVKQRVPELVKAGGGRSELVLVGPSSTGPSEVHRFTGVPVLAEVADDPAAAAVVNTGSGPRRRLQRSSLVVSARRLAWNLAAVGQSADTPSTPDAPSRDDDVHGPVASSAVTPAPVPEVPTLSVGGQRRPADRIEPVQGGSRVKISDRLTGTWRPRHISRVNGARPEVSDR
jgi:hypothetical protein